jgi:hypothetical protein
VLSDAIFSARIEVNDVLRLYSQGISQVSIAELEAGEIDEDEAVMQLAREIGRGSIEARLVPGGKVNLFATEPSCVLVDDRLLKEVNYLGGVAVATLANFSYAETGARISSVKSIPFAVDKLRLDRVLSLIQDKGPVLTCWICCFLQCWRGIAFRIWTWLAWGTAVCWLETVVGKISLPPFFRSVWHDSYPYWNRGSVPFTLP